MRVKCVAHEPGPLDPAECSVLTTRPPRLHNEVDSRSKSRNDCSNAAPIFNALQVKISYCNRALDVKINVSFFAVILVNIVCFPSGSFRALFISRTKK